MYSRSNALHRLLGQNSDEQDHAKTRGCESRPYRDTNPIVRLTNIRIVQWLEHLLLQSTSASFTACIASSGSCACYIGRLISPVTLSTRPGGSLLPPGYLNCQR